MRMSRYAWGRQPFPGDCPFGVLTSRGVDQQLANGDKFRQMYLALGGLFPLESDEKKDYLYLRSGERERVRMSLDAFLSSFLSHNLSLPNEEVTFPSLYWRLSYHSMMCSHDLRLIFEVYPVETTQDELDNLTPKILSHCAAAVDLLNRVTQANSDYAQMSREKDELLNSLRSVFQVSPILSGLYSFAPIV